MGRIFMISVFIGTRETGVLYPSKGVRETCLYCSSSRNQEHSLPTPGALRHCNGTSSQGTSYYLSPCPREYTGQAAIAVHDTVILQLFWYLFGMMSTEVEILQFLLTAIFFNMISITGSLVQFKIVKVLISVETFSYHRHNP